MIAVMGASGNVGGKVSDRLLGGGHEVRIFGRSAERLETLADRGAEVVVGDAINPDDVHLLFSDVVAALVVLPDNVADRNYSANRSKMSHAIADALRDQHVENVVFASSLGAQFDHGVGQIAGLHELEELLFGLEEATVVALRAAWHMENLLIAVPMVQDQKINGTVIRSELRFPMTACEDVAEQAVRRLLDPHAAGHVVETVLGPEDRTMEEATRALGDVLGIPDLPYVQFPPEGVKAALLGIGMSEEFASLLVESHLAINEGRIVEGVVRGPENTTPTRLEDFLRSAIGG